MRIAQHHLNFRLSEDRCERYEVSIAGKTRRCRVAQIGHTSNSFSGYAGFQPAWLRRDLDAHPLCTQDACVPSENELPLRSDKRNFICPIFCRKISGASFAYFAPQPPFLPEQTQPQPLINQPVIRAVVQALFDERHNPLWKLGVSSDGATLLLNFWQQRDAASGELKHDFTDGEWSTRFLGDLYQDLSEAARKKYALLQTPIFVEEFILDRTLTPAIQEFGYEQVRLIDPTCGSEHFLLGAFQRLFTLHLNHNSTINARELAQRALNSVYGVDVNPFAVAIARFRLLMAALTAGEVARLQDAPAFTINVATGDSLLHGPRPGMIRGVAQNMFDDQLQHYDETEDKELLDKFFGQQYHAVVGNPPYITVKDKALNQAYRVRFTSCHMRCSLAVPFVERFFELVIEGKREAPGSAGVPPAVCERSDANPVVRESTEEEAISSQGTRAAFHALAAGGTPALPGASRSAGFERAFKIVLARKMAAGEVTTTWFARHGSTPMTELPAHWPDDYRQLVERRIALIESNANIRLIEQPEYKRRWNSEAWDVQAEPALGEWLLNRLEDTRYWTEPKLTSVARLSDRIGTDAEWMQVADMYRGRYDFDVLALVTELVKAEAVPFLPIFRYKPSGTD